MPLNNGESFAGFRIVRLLGSGGMGAVYLAERADLKQKVALKIIRQGADSEIVLKRFRREQFFRNARQYFQCAGNLVLLHQFFQDEHGRHVHRHAGIVSFPVSRRSLDDRIVIRNARLLRSPRYAVNIRNERDNRLAGTVRRHPCGRNACDSLFDLETVLRQDVGDADARCLARRRSVATSRDKSRGSGASKLTRRPVAG